MADYSAYMPAVGSTAYPVQISNFITISEAFDTEIEIARNGEATLLDGINLKLSLTGGTLTGGLTLSSGTVIIGTDTVAVKDAALTNTYIISADSIGRITTSSGIVAANIATLSGIQTISGNKTFSGTNIISGINTFTAIPAFNGGLSGTSAPFTVDSTQVVTNLNADLLDGLNSTSFNQIIGTNTNISLSTASVVSTITMTDGVITGHTSRTLTPANIGAATSSHSHSASEITTGTLAVVRGGTGVTSSTGTGNIVRSVSPVLTGNPTAPTQATGNDSTRLATTAFVNNMSLGIGQTNQNVTTSRSLNVVYYNTTGKPIYVYGYCSTTTVQNMAVQLDGETITLISGYSLGAAVPFYILVPPGSSYRVNPSGLYFSLDQWFELR